MGYDMVRPLEEALVGFQPMRDTKQKSVYDLSREIVDLGDELKVSNERLDEALKANEALSKDLQESREIAQTATGKCTRITHLLRSTLPQQYQHGFGIDGMVQSLLALVVSLQQRLTEEQNK